MAVGRFDFHQCAEVPLADPASATVAPDRKPKRYWHPRAARLTGRLAAQILEFAERAFCQRLGFRDMGNALYLLPISPASFGAAS